MITLLQECSWSSWCSCCLILLLAMRIFFRCKPSSMIYLISMINLPPRWPNKLGSKTALYYNPRFNLARYNEGGLYLHDITPAIQDLRILLRCHFYDTRHDLRFNILAPKLVTPAIQDGVHYACPMTIPQWIVGSLQAAASSKHATNLQSLLKCLARLWTSTGPLHRPNISRRRHSRMADGRIRVSCRVFDRSGWVFCGRSLQSVVRIAGSPALLSGIPEADETVKVRQKIAEKEVIHEARNLSRY